MSAGKVWELPDGRKAVELDGSCGGLLRVSPIVPNWPFPGPPEIVAERLCVEIKSRRDQQADDGFEEARW